MRVTDDDAATAGASTHTDRAPGRRLTARGRERRSQLIAYATRRFADDGFHPTSVADIVSGLGVGKGVFYWYFSSKEELFTEILRSAQSDLRRTQRRAIGDIDDPVRRVEEGIRAGAIWMAHNPDLRKLFEFARTDEAFAKAIRVGQRRHVADAVEHLRAAIDAGLIPERDPEALAHGILGVTHQVTMHYLDDVGGSDGQLSAEQIADLVVAICRNGFAGE
ncbi:MAG: TetR/AcrR family transcriptional regulator [Microthrixaceae bacterium]